MQHKALGNQGVQYITSIAPLSPTTFWVGASEASPFSSWLIDVANTIKPPLVLSITWGSDEDQVTRSELDSFDTAAMKLGLMGVTIVAASGVKGAHSIYDWFKNSSIDCNYSPLFPATSRYVLSVGGTMVGLMHIL